MEYNVKFIDEVDPEAKEWLQVTELCAALETYYRPNPWKRPLAEEIYQHSDGHRHLYYLRDRRSGFFGTPDEVRQNVCEFLQEKGCPENGEYVLEPDWMRILTQEDFRQALRSYPKTEYSYEKTLPRNSVLYHADVLSHLITILNNSPPEWVPDEYKGWLVDESGREVSKVFDNELGLYDGCKALPQVLAATDVLRSGGSGREFEEITGHRSAAFNSVFELIREGYELKYSPEITELVRQRKKTKPYESGVPVIGALVTLVNSIPEEHVPEEYREWLVDSTVLQE